MKNKKKILIAYELSNLSGAGHYYRAIKLYKFLKNDFDIKIYDLNKVKNIKNLKKFNLIILDLKKYSLQKLRNIFSNLSGKILTIENFNNQFGNYNISIFDHSKKNYKSRFSGLKFAIVETVNKFPKKKKNFFISMGYNPKKNNIKKIIKFIKKNGNINFTIAKNLKNKIKIKLSNIKYCNNTNYKQEFMSSNIAITNAGLTLIEGLYYRIPCIVLPQTAYEKRFSQYLLKKKLILSFKKKIIKIPNKLETSTVKNKIYKIVDGKGLYRIKKLINKIFDDKNI